MSLVRLVLPRWLVWDGWLPFCGSYDLMRVQLFCTSRVRFLAHHLYTCGVLCRYIGQNDHPAFVLWFCEVLQTNAKLRSINFHAASTSVKTILVLKLTIVLRKTNQTVIDSYPSSVDIVMGQLHPRWRMQKYHTLLMLWPLFPNPMFQLSTEYPPWN